MKPSFAIIGCGKVGTALGKYLVQRGYPAGGFASRNMASAKNAAEMAGADGRYFKYPWKAAITADIVLITTPDGAIADVCREVAAHRGFRENSIVLHCSGALPSTILADAKECGAAIGSMHPLQSFAEVRSENPFEGIMMSLEGDPDAVRCGHNMAVDLGAVPFVINTEGKILYHAGAVVASNYMVTLMALAIRLLMLSGVKDSEAFQILKPLVRGTLSNIERVGITNALTGPIARGDSQTVAAHISAIQQMAADLLELYKTMGKATIPIAVDKGTLSTEAAREILTLLTS